MTQWNSSYYRSKNYIRVIKGSVDSLIYAFPFLPAEAEISSVFLESITKYNDSSTDLAKFILLSPSLTYNILNLAQSPFFNSNKNISSLNDAISVIGNDIAIQFIKDILIRSSIAKEIGSMEPSTNSDYYGSLKSAHLSALVSEELKFSSSFTAYVAALLHNVGSVVLSIKFPVQYSRLNNVSANYSSSESISAEENALGLNHCFLGARMVEHWSVFPFIADALFYHHHPLNKIKQSSKLVRLIYFSSMVDGSGESYHSQIIETGKELFGFTGSQIDEYLSIAELKVQNRLMNLGIEVSDDNSDEVYRPGYQREKLNLNEADNNSLLSTLIDHIHNFNNEKDILNQIGKSLYILTGLREVYYFKYNEGDSSLTGVSLKQPEDTKISNDFSISLDEKSSIIVNSFLMGMDINSLDRVNSIEPALFDLQMANCMGADGLYCLPLVNKDNTTGVIVLGIYPGVFAIENEIIKRLHSYTEAITPFLLNKEPKSSFESAEIKNVEANSLQTRKLIHEINNPLSAMKNYLKVLNMKLNDLDVESDEIRIIDDELNRVAKLLKEFKSSSPDKSNKRTSKTTSSINLIISDTILLIKNTRLNGPEINIDLDMDDNLPDIMIDKDAFRQVLINLINNSIEAMPKGGNISVDVRFINGGHQENAQGGSSEDNGMRVEISVSDDGPGFPDKLKANIFKIQSTTKADHDGLGLLIVHELVKKMGGSVFLDDQFKKGTCFKIMLPVV